MSGGSLVENQQGFRVENVDADGESVSILK